MRIIRTMASLAFAAASFWLVSVIAAPVKDEAWNNGVATADAVSGWAVTR